MFSVHCETHRSNVLLTARNIETITNDEHGIHVHWRCACGQRGTFLTGLARTAVAA